MRRGSVSMKKGKTPNAQRRTSNLELPNGVVAGAEFEIGRWTLGVRRFLPPALFFLRGATSGAYCAEPYATTSSQSRARTRSRLAGLLVLVRTSSRQGTGGRTPHRNQGSSARQFDRRAGRDHPRNPHFTRARAAELTREL